MKINFFHLMSLKNGGGCENDFIRMAASLAKKSYEVRIVSATEAFHNLVVFMLGIFYGGIFRPGKSKYFRFSDKEIMSRLASVAWEKCGYFKLRKILNQSDVLYSKNEILDMLALKFLFIKRPVIVGMHTNIHYPVASGFHEKLHNAIYKSFFYRWLIKKCDYFRVFNREDKEFLIREHRIKVGQIELIGNGIDVEHFSQAYIEREEFRVLFVGRLAPQKGISDLAKIILKLNRMGYEDKIFFTVVGEGALKDEFLDKINDVKNVEVLSQVSYDDMPGLYQRADICLVPSHWETFNSVVLEAQSCGLPVISYDIPGPREMISHDETGYLIPKGETELISKKIVDLYDLKKSDRQSFNKICNSARGNIVAKFSNDQVFSQLRKLIYKGGQECVDI